MKRNIFISTAVVLGFCAFFFSLYLIAVGLFYMTEGPYEVTKIEPRPLQVELNANENAWGNGGLDTSLFWL